MLDFISNFFGKHGNISSNKAPHKKKQWLKLCQDGYAGHGGFIDGKYLIPYRREEESDFESRQEQAYYLNIMGPMIDSLISPVFTQDILREYNNPLFDPFVEDADGKGASLTLFAKQAVTVANVMGQSFVIMDSFPGDEIPPTQAQQITERKVPFACLKTPLDVYSYESDKFERLVSITFYNGKNADGDQLLIRYDDENITEYCMKEGKEVVIKTTPHGLGVIPVIPTMYGDILPIPPTLSLAQTSKALYNQLSELRELSRDSSFSLLVIPGADPKVTIEVGSKNSLFVPKDISNMPDFISPDTKINENQLNEIKFTVESLLSQGELKGASVQKGNMSVKSGVALAFEFHASVTALDDNANAAAALEEKISEIFGLQTAPFEYTVVYARDYMPFSSDEVAKQFEFLTDMLSLNITSDINAEIHVQLLDLLKFNTGMDNDVYQKLKQTIKTDLIIANNTDDDDEVD